MLDDLPDQPIATRLLGREPEVAARVFLDALERLPSLLCEDAVQPIAHLEDLARLDLDVARRATRPARRLVEQKARVGEAVAVFARHGHVNQGRDARDPPGAHHPHAGTQEPHQVMARIALFPVPVLGVEEPLDVVARFAGHGEQLRGHVGRYALRDLARENHDARAEQALRHQVVSRGEGRLEGTQLFHRDSGVEVSARERRWRSSTSARVTYTRVICLRHDRSKSVLSRGLAGRYAAAAAAAIASSESSVPTSAPPASGTSCGQLATPPSTMRASATFPVSHLTHAATPSTGKSNASRRRSL